MITEIRGRACRSWLDVRYSRVLAASLSRRLWDRCRGHDGVFLTLTYRRDDYDSPLDLWRTQQLEQHIPLFMRRLARFLDRDLSGQWLCKAEFQRGGWVHFHIILLGVKFIEHEPLTECWGHGHVWIKRLSRRRVHYTCKYISKDAALPVFLYAERRVRIVRTSKGFWPEADSSPHPSPVGEECQRLDAYVPIGDRLALASTETIARDPVTDRYCKIPMPCIDVLAFARRHGVRVVGASKGWLRLLVDRVDLYRACVRSRPGTRGEAAGPAGLHLKNKHKDDACPFRAWVDLLICERMAFEMEPT